MPLAFAIGDSRAHQRVQQRQLVAHRGEPMKLHKSQRGRAGQIRPSTKNTRSQGTKTFSNTVSVSIIL